MRSYYKKGGGVRKDKGMKGMSIKSGDKRPTKSGAGMTAKGVAKYRRQKHTMMTTSQTYMVAQCGHVCLSLH
jgi:hypothetical protein